VVFVPLCDNALICTVMVRIIKAPTKSIRPGSSSKGKAHADDSIDESEFSEEELSDEDSDYKHGM
jgi:hypothetical protein